MLVFLILPVNCSTFSAIQGNGDSSSAVVVRVNAENDQGLPFFFFFDK